MRANNNHSHLSIKNCIKSLILVMFLTLCAKMTKKSAREAGEGGFCWHPLQHAESKKKKRSAKMGGAFARIGKMLSSIYIYIIIYNII